MLSSLQTATHIPLLCTYVVGILPHTSSNRPGGRCLTEATSQYDRGLIRTQLAVAVVTTDFTNSALHCAPLHIAAGVNKLHTRRRFQTGYLHIGLCTRVSGCTLVAGGWRRQFSPYQGRAGWPLGPSASLPRLRSCNQPEIHRHLSQ